jgi:hypothetical protein
MNAKTRVLTWIVETIMLFIVYSALCYLLPDVELYDLYTRNFGFITELAWNENYTLVLFIASIFINTLLIYLWALKKNK